MLVDREHVGRPIDHFGLGKDTWLYPNAQERQTLLLSMAQRADVVIDFTDAPNEVFIENTLSQDDGLAEWLFCTGAEEDEKLLT